MIRQMVNHIKYYNIHYHNIVETAGSRHPIAITSQYSSLASQGEVYY